MDLHFVHSAKKQVVKLSSIRETLVLLENCYGEMFWPRIKWKQETPSLLWSATLVYLLPWYFDKPLQFENSMTRYLTHVELAKNTVPPDSSY